MKKIITFLMAASLIFAFAGIAAAADCSTCTAPGIINRACDLEQDECLSVPFDYEDVDEFGSACDDEVDWTDNFCGPTPKLPRRALFPACDCENFEEDDVIDIRMEILVNGQTGNNGAYWAEMVNSIDMNTYVSETAACDDGHNYDGKSFNYSAGDGNMLEFLRYNEDGDIVPGTPLLTDCVDCDLLDNETYEQYQVTIIQPDVSDINGNCVPHGYVIDQDDDTLNLSVWAVNIPHIRFDPTMVGPGDEISVQISLAQAIEDGEGTNCWDVDLGGICGDTGCACQLLLGTLGCCEEETKNSLIYPYATPMNDANWWYGMVITNIDSEDGQAEVTVYETDGDTATVVVDVAANNMYVANNQMLMDAFGGDIGDARAYFKVVTDFDASGFFFIGNDAKAEAMGYLPE